MASRKASIADVATAGRAVCKLNTEIGRAAMRLLRGVPPPLTPAELMAAALKDEVMKRNTIAGQEVQYFASICSVLVDSWMPMQRAVVENEETRERQNISDFQFFTEFVQRSDIMREELTQWSGFGKDARTLKLMSLETLETQYRSGIAKQHVGIRISEQRFFFAINEMASRIPILLEESQRRQNTLLLQKHIIQQFGLMQKEEKARGIIASTEDQSSNADSSKRRNVAYGEDRCSLNLQEQMSRSAICCEERVAAQDLMLKRAMIGRCRIVLAEANELVTIDDSFELYQLALQDICVMRRCRELRRKIDEIEAKKNANVTLISLMATIRKENNLKQKCRTEEQIDELNSAIADLEFKMPFETNKKQLRMLQDEHALKKGQVAKLIAISARTWKSEYEEVARETRLKSLKIDPQILTGHKTALVRKLEMEADELKKQEKRIVNEVVEKIIHPEPFDGRRQSATERRGSATRKGSLWQDPNIAAIQSAEREREEDRKRDLLATPPDGPAPESAYMRRKRRSTIRESETKEACITSANSSSTAPPAGFTSRPDAAASVPQLPLIPSTKRQSSAAVNSKNFSDDPMSSNRVQRQRQILL